MVYEGAKGKTAQEMQSVLGFPEIEILRKEYLALHQSLNQKTDKYELNIANALWGQEKYPFLPEYLQRVEKYYGGKLNNLDFVNQTEAAIQTINNYIAKQTKDKIKDLLAKDTLSGDTRLVLTNAIYFKGSWQFEFAKKDTKELPFKLDSGKTINTELMHLYPKENLFRYYENNLLKAIELPYDGERLSMLIILPHQNISSLADWLTASNLASAQKEMQEEEIETIALPKFKFDTKYQMKKTLIDMGMSTAFSNLADFSGMDGTDSLYIDKVIHQAFVKVDEEGTEAAAATAVGMAIKSAIEEKKPKKFIADHPFLFIIQDNQSRAILFLGQIKNPSFSNN